MTAPSGTRPPLVVIHPSNDWYGSDRMLVALVGALTSEGRSVRVLLPEVPAARTLLEERLEQLGASTWRASVPALRRRDLTVTGVLRLAARLLVFAWAFRKSVSRDSVTLLNTSALAPLSPVLRVMGYSTIGYLHEVPEGAEARLLGLMWRASRGLIAISNAVRDSFAGTTHSRICVVRNCSDRVKAVPLPQAPPLKFLFIGRLTPRKGIRELVRCFGELDSRHHHLTVIGGTAALGAGIDFSDLRRQMHDFDVDYIGEVSDPGPYIDRCHVVVVPSLLPEGLGLAAVEALARLRPVVATEVRGLTEVVDTEVGWTLDPSNISSWPELIQSINPNDVALRSSECAVRFNELFSPEVYRREICACLTRFGAM